MSFRAVVLVGIIIAAVNGACPATPTGGCSVCGEGKCVSKPDAIFQFGTQPAVACGTLEELGYAGRQEIVQYCSVFPTLIGICDCNAVGVPSTPVPTTSAPITPEPTTSKPITSTPQPTTPKPTTPKPTTATNACPATPPGGCSVCGEGKCVSKPDAIFQFGTQPPIACGTLQELGYAGRQEIVDNCDGISSIIGVCQCGSAAVPTTPAPTPPTPTTPKPTTSKPTPQPTPTTNSCPATPAGGCSICGEGKCVSKPDAIFQFGTQPPVACGTLQELGYAGRQEIVDNCAGISSIIDVCECTSAGVATTPSPTPPKPTTPQPTPATNSCPATPAGGCSICGEGKCVSKPDAIFQFGTQPPITCGTFEGLGYAGRQEIVDNCAGISSIIDVCECSSAGVATTPAPTPPTPTTPKPTTSKPTTPQPTTATNSCPATPAGGCSICGEGKCVSKPDAIFQFGTQPPVACGTLEALGYAGRQEIVDNCAGISSIIDVCECRSAGVPATPVPTTAPKPATPKPTTATNACPATPAGGCSICGEGKCVSKPDAIFQFGTQPSVACGTLEALGYAGRQEIVEYCSVFPTLIGICECSDGGVPATPVPTTAPKPATPKPTTATNACPATPAGGCSICGEGKCVSKPDAIFQFGTQPPVACGTLEALGYAGRQEIVDNCAGISSIIDVCECSDGGAPPPPAPPAPTPSKPTTPKPTPGTSACPATPAGGCSICGEGKCVSKPDAIFQFGTQPPVACGTLESLGYEGRQEIVDNCAGISSIIDVCECSDGGAPPPPAPLAPTPSKPSTPEPTPGTNSCPATPAGGCSICGEGKCVSKPDAIFQFGTQPPIACGTLEALGYAGRQEIVDNCAGISSIIGVCECNDAGVIDPPFSTNEPSPKPSTLQIPTKKPTREPTRKPNCCH